MKKILALSAMTVMTLVLPACSSNQSALNNPPGHYERTVESTDAAGTTRKVAKETDVWYDQYGNKHAATETKKSTDPKGLFNKEETTTIEKDVEPAAQ